MTNEQINKAIAEACGWTDCNEYIGKPPIPKMDQYNRSIPNYSRCLNAMHEAEKVIVDRGYWAMRDYDQQLSLIAPAWEWNATARQRAEAFLRTLGKWEEEA